MKTLAPNLFERRFDDLMAIGRAKLPSLMPSWTDHNAHDPGITLMELLAWVAEAELWAVSRQRRDERAAYAALVGLSRAGTRAATGLLWSDRLDPRSPAATYLQSVVIAEDAVVNVVNHEKPTFCPTHKTLWVPGTIAALEAWRGRRRLADHTETNRRGGPGFLPFGNRAGPRDVLRLTFQCRGAAGLFGLDRDAAKGAVWSIGVRAASSAAAPASRCAKLEAALVQGHERVPLKIVSDSTAGFLTNGALLLDVDGISGSPRELTIELRAPRGFERPPRVLRIEPGVVRVRQGRAIEDAAKESKGLPDWSLELDARGLRFEAGAEPIELTVDEGAGQKPWRRVDRLSELGPREVAFELDAAAGRVTFGNGINGRIPPQESKVYVKYSVSDGEEGNVARNRAWRVAGFEGAFGVNLDAVAGGEASAGWIDLRRNARRRVTECHALVTADDIVEAAKALPLLEVERAWIPRRSERTPRTGVVTLVAMRRRAADEGTDGPAESPRWVESIRALLAPRLPMGMKLVVAWPRYVVFTLTATIEAARGLDPKTVHDDVVKAIRARLEGRTPGAPLTGRDLIAWVRGVAGVAHVVELRLRDASGRPADRLSVPGAGLPSWDSDRSTIEVRRAGEDRAS